jgi:hypothetical protein
MRIVQVLTVIVCAMLATSVQADVAAPHVNAFPPLHSPINPYPQDPPLFAAFKTFCVDTGTKVSEVGAAVLAAGGTFRNRRSTDNMSITVWSLNFRRGRMSVEATGIYPSRLKNGDSDMEACTIFYTGDDDASVAALQKWVGVPRQYCVLQSPCYYEYQVHDSAHEPIMSNAEQLSARMRGQDWTLMLDVEPGHIQAGLQHWLPPANSSSPPQQ